MEFGPDAGAGSPDQQTHGFAAVAEGHHKQAGAPVLAALRVAHQRAGAVIDLSLFSSGGEDNTGRFGRLRPTQLANETPHRLVAAGEAVVRNQVLPDGHGVAAASEPLLDQFPIGLAGAG
jgi:hypothetical protein